MTNHNSNGDSSTSSTSWATLPGSEIPASSGGATDVPDPGAHEPSAREDDSRDGHGSSDPFVAARSTCAIGQDNDGTADGGVSDRLARANGEERSPAAIYRRALAQARQFWPHGKLEDWVAYANWMADDTNNIELARLGGEARARLIQCELDWRASEAEKAKQEAASEGGLVSGAEGVGAETAGGESITTEQALDTTDRLWMTEVQSRLGLKHSSDRAYAADKANEAIDQRFSHLGAGWLTNALVAALMAKHKYTLADGTVCGFTPEAFSSLVSQAIEEDERLRGVTEQLRAGLTRVLEKSVEQAGVSAQKADKPIFVGMVAACVVVIGLIGWLIYADVKSSRSLDAAAVASGYTSYEAVLEKIGATSEDAALVAVASVALRADDTANQALDLAQGELAEERDKSGKLFSDVQTAAQNAAISATEASAAAASAASAASDATRAQTSASRATTVADALAMALDKTNRGLTALVNGNSCVQDEVVTLRSGATRNKFVCGTAPSTFDVLCLGTAPPNASGCSIAP